MVDPRSQISPPYHYRGSMRRGSVTYCLSSSIGAGKVVVFYFKSKEVCCSDNISAPTTAKTPCCCEYIAIYVL